MKRVKVKDFYIGEGEPLAVMCGPCVIEGEEIALRAAKELVPLFDSLGIPFIYKSSYDKANRSSIHSYRGPGLDEGLRILEKVKKEFGVPIVTDIHTAEEAALVAEVADILQIPAFLCRQTDLLVAAAKTGRVVEVKKGQFMAPWDMEQVVNKLKEAGSEEILLLDRGTSFGYNNLVADLRSIPSMQKFGYPVGFDATHSVQLPGGAGSSSSGQREYIKTLAQAFTAAGSHFLFLEAHEDPANALCDRDNQLSFAALPELLKRCQRIHAALGEG